MVDSERSIPKFSFVALSLTLFIVVLYLLYAGLMIYDSSVLIKNQRWFCLLDDAMISMRYARNLANGLGLVWNAGEHVEGITNPGWTFIMSAVHLIENNRAYTSLYLQVLSALFLAVTIWIVAKLSWYLSQGSLAVTLIAASATAFYYPLNYFSLYGMETGILAFMITLAVAVYIFQTAHRRFPFACYLILGLATIVRIDMAIPLMVVGIYGFFSATNKTLRLRHVYWCVGTLMLFVGAQTVARLIYYGYPFPNTYYLKMTGFDTWQRMARGAWVTIPTLWHLFWPILLVGLAAGIKSYRNHRGHILKSATFQNIFNLIFSDLVLLPMYIFLAQATYSIYVGGDAWEWHI